jgi:hypothetical protein
MNAKDIHKLRDIVSFGLLENLHNDATCLYQSCLLKRTGKISRYLQSQIRITVDLRPSEGKILYNTPRNYTVTPDMGTSSEPEKTPLDQIAGNHTILKYTEGPVVPKI